MLISPSVYSGSRCAFKRWESVEVYILECCHIWLWLCNARCPMRQQRALLGETKGDRDRIRRMTATVARQPSNEYPNNSSLFSI